MSPTYFLDTNIFLYQFDRMAPLKAARAQRIIEDAVVSGLGAISYQVIQEFCNVASGVRTRMQNPDAEVYLGDLFARLFTVHSSLELFRAGLQHHRRFQLPWYDALIVAAAQQARCEVLYSEDFQHGQRFGDLRVENPFL